MTPAQNLALGGRRVLEIADEKGVYCGKLLADLGADVVKIERPGGDRTRDIPPFLNHQPHSDGSLFFTYMNTNKRSVTLDITDPAGQALFKTLARTADILIETFPPGYMDSLGLGYETLGAMNRGLVFTSITDFGQSGPHKNYKSCDLVTMAMSSVMYVTGEPADPPVTLAGRQSYIVASAYGATSSLIALYYRESGGEGQHVDISAQEAVTAVANISGVAKYLEDGIIPQRNGTTSFTTIPSGTYPCKDGLVSIFINRPAHWVALAKWLHEVTGNNDVLDPMFRGPGANRQPYRELIDVWLGDFTPNFTVDEIYHEAQRRHLAFAPLKSASTLIADPQLASRGYFVEMEKPGEERRLCPGAPYRLSETPWSLRRQAPTAGQHNVEVFCQELGISAERLAWLQKAGTV